MIELRDYQLRCVQAVKAAYLQGSRFPVLVAPTGAGKTIMFCWLAAETKKKGNPVLLVAHRKEIVKQISGSLSKFGIKHKIVADKKTTSEIKNADEFVCDDSIVCVASVQTLARHMERVDLSSGNSLLIVDECHHMVRDTQWGTVIDAVMENIKARGVGVTATPERLDGRGLGKEAGNFADKLIQGPSVSELMRDGWLSPYRMFSAPNTIDVSGCHRRCGDFATSEIEERAGKPCILGDAVAEWKKHAAGMRTVIFCPSVRHSKMTAEKFCENGIPTRHLDGGTPADERAETIKNFAEGKLICLTNVNLFSEGFDLSSIAGTDVTIDCVVDLSPTMSLTLALQRWGRALRPSPGKTAIIIDSASNVSRHGFPDDEREWSLNGSRGQRCAKRDPEAVKIRTCPECFSIHRPAPVCPVCGHVYEAEARKIETKEGELVEIKKNEMEEKRKNERKHLYTFEALKKFGIEHGYKPGWAWNVWKNR